MRDIAHLVEILSDGETHEFFIQLRGAARSSKSMYHMGGGVYDICNMIDSTWQELTADEIMDPSETNIGSAIRVGAFFWWKPNNEVQK